MADTDAMAGLPADGDMARCVATLAAKGAPAAVVLSLRVAVADLLALTRAGDR